MKTKHTNKFIVLILSVMMIAALFVGMSVTASAATNSGLKPGDTFYFTPSARHISQTQEVKVRFLDENGDEIIDPSSDSVNFPYPSMTKGDGDIWSLVIPDGAHEIANIFLFENGSSFNNNSVDTVLSEAPGIYLNCITGIEAWLTTTYTAPEAGEAKIYAVNVNLGGDISMKYYVEVGTGVEIDNLVLETFFLGKVEALTAADQTVTIDGHTLYVYTLTSINPQCMGDPIDAKLVYNDVAMEGDRVNKNGYSVKDNLVSVYDNGNYATKQLIIDTLEYGAAAQTYRGYKTNALVTDGLPEAMTAHLNDEERNFDNTIPKSTPNVSETIANTVKESSVVFGTTNFIKISYTDGETKILTSGAIAAYDFAKKMQFSVDGLFTLGYSVNDYCYDAINSETTSDNMKALAQALYNYGLSAHFVKGNHSGENNATCMHGKICEICAHEYGDSLEHNYTYVVDTNTITESCDRGCGHEASVKLEAANAVYDGTPKPATLTYIEGTALQGATPTIVYDVLDGSTPVNAGNYMAFLNVGPHSVYVAYTIEKATPEVTIPPTANNLTYNGTEQPLVSAGSVNYGTILYSLTGEDESFTEAIPTGTTTGRYRVYYYVQGNKNYNDTPYNYIEVTINKADPTLTVPTELTATYGDTLAKVALNTATGDTAGAWTWNDGDTTSVGNAGTQIFKATFTPTDSTNYNTVEVELTIAVAKATVTVTVNAQVKTYGEADPELTYTVSGLIGSDTVTGALARAEGENAGTYAINLGTLSAGDNYTFNFVGADLTITTKDVSGATVELGEYNSVYDGNAKTPAVTVTLDGNTLVKDTDYAVTYTNNVYVGTATVTVTFKGNYEGTVTKTFEIAQDSSTTEFDGEWVTIPKE